MRFKNTIFGILSLLVAGLALHLFKETGWAIVIERALEEAAHSLHIEKAAMAAYLFQVMIVAAVIWLCLQLAFRLGQKERPVKEDPLVAAQREHAAAINAQTEAIKKPATQTVRSAFSQTQTINNFPPFLGGNMALHLDNVATLRLAAPYSMQMVTLRLDTVPMDMKAKFDPAQIQVTGPQIYFGQHQEFVFDVHQNKRREIEVLGRTFIVTLIQVKRNETINMAKAIEWVFGISEK